MEIETLRQAAAEEGTSDAVVKSIKPRREGANTHHTGYDNDDATANTGLGWESNVEVERALDGVGHLREGVPHVGL